MESVFHNVSAIYSSLTPTKKYAAQHVITKQNINLIIILYTLGFQTSKTPSQEVFGIVPLQPQFLLNHPCTSVYFANFPNFLLDETQVAHFLLFGARPSSTEVSSKRRITEVWLLRVARSKADSSKSVRLSCDKKKSKVEGRTSSKKKKQFALGTASHAKRKQVFQLHIFHMLRQFWGGFTVRIQAVGALLPQLRKMVRSFKKTHGIHKANKLVYETEEIIIGSEPVV